MYLFTTDQAAPLRSLSKDDPIARRQGTQNPLRAVPQRDLADTTVESGGAEKERPGTKPSSAKYEAPAPRAELQREATINATPLEVWQGVVKEIDRENGVMKVNLDALMSKVPRHTAEIELEWVAEQDEDLVKPGAVFYLTLFKRTKPSVENAQELRFRRRPAWTQEELRQVEVDAELIRSKMKSLRTAND